MGGFAGCWRRGGTVGNTEGDFPSSCPLQETPIPFSALHPARSGWSRASPWTGNCPTTLLTPPILSSKHHCWHLSRLTDFIQPETRNHPPSPRERAKNIAPASHTARAVASRGGEGCPHHTPALADSRDCLPNPFVAFGEFLALTALELVIN